MLPGCEKDLWEYLKQSNKTVVLYGMGNGGDKILDVCDQKGIAVSGVFASDGFARGNLFHGMPVRTWSETKGVYGAENVIVLLSFGTSRDEVLENILRIASEAELYAPDVPAFGDGLFDRTYFEAHRSELETARALLCDEESRRIFDDVLQYKLTGDIRYLLDAESDLEAIWKCIIYPERIRFAADLGAYNGDTALDLLKRAPHIQRIVALEPDPKTFIKLQKNTAGLPVKAVHGAAWREDTTLLFTASGGRGAGVGAVGKKTAEIPAYAPDSLFERGERVDYLKYDVEGAELDALEGSRRLLEESRPRLLVSCYHRPEDLFLLPLWLKDHFPFYKLYLRRHKGIPAWDINLYAVPEEREA